MEETLWRPIGHHWFDATHITYGVITFGWNAVGRAKIEGSIFYGREPDEDRWDFDSMRLDSYSMRFTLNPTENWSIQGSAAMRNEPERLPAKIGYLRMTAAPHQRLQRGQAETSATRSISCERNGSA